MKIAIQILGLLLVIAGLLYHFAALDVFNALVPKHPAQRLASDVAYGPNERHKLDIYAPASGAGPWPVVLFVHGGSWSAGHKNGYGFVGRALAAQGFLAVVISYRLHPQFRYPAFVEDTALALKWTENNAAKFGGNPTKLFAVGHSAGAYNVAQAVLSAEITPKANLKGVITLAGPFDFLPLDTRVTKDVFGGFPDLPKTQPINHVSSKAPAFLILHGEADTTVFPRNAQSLHRSLIAAGAQADLKLYPGINHVSMVLALAKPLTGRAPVLEDIARFVRDKSQ